MKKYDFLTVESDFITHKKHLFYLCGMVNTENCGYVIASYSVKTDRMILKDCSNFVPDTDILKRFVEIAKKRYKESEKDE